MQNLKIYNFYWSFWWKKELLVTQSLFSKLSDTRGKHLSVFQFVGICQDGINSFSLDSSSVQDFSLWGTSLYLPINLSCIREFSSAMNQSRFLCFSSPPSSSRSPSSSFHHNHMYGFSSLFFIKCFHLIFVSIHNNGFT